MEELGLVNFFEDFDIIDNVKKILNIKNTQIMADFLQKQKQLNKLKVKEGEEENKEQEKQNEKEVKSDVKKEEEQSISIINVFDYLEEIVNNYIVNAELRKCYSDLDFVDIKLYNNYYIGSDVSFGDNVIVERPVVIGDNVKIGNNVVIRPYTILSSNTSVGNGTEVKATYLLPNSKIASNCFVGDTILGKNSRIGSGVVTSNRRFDQKNIKLKDIKSNDKNYEFDTMRAFFGAIIGNDTRLGANVTTYPGTLIGFNSMIYPGVVVNKNIMPNTRVKLTQNLEFVPNKRVKLN